MPPRGKGGSRLVGQVGGEREPGCAPGELRWGDWLCPGHKEGKFRTQQVHIGMNLVVGERSDVSVCEICERLEPMTNKYDGTKDETLI